MCYLWLDLDHIYVYTKNVKTKVRKSKKIGKLNFDFLNVYTKVVGLWV